MDQTLCSMLCCLHYIKLLQCELRGQNPAIRQKGEFRTAEAHTCCIAYACMMREAVIAPVAIISTFVMGE